MTTPSPLTESITSTIFDGKQRRLFLTYCALPLCRKPFYAPKHCHKRYCSKICGIAARKTQIQVQCAFCLSYFEKTRRRIELSKSGLVFCSRSCKDQAQSIISGQKFDDMRPDHYGNGGYSATYRNIAFQHHGKACQKCGYNRYESVLNVHHKDRNRGNSFPENLEVLCPTCHIEIHFLAHDGLFTPHKKNGGDGENRTPDSALQGQRVPATTTPPNLGAEEENRTPV